MQKANAVPEGETHIAVAVTRLGSDPIALKLAVGTTVAQAITASGVSSGSNAQFFVDGERANGDDFLEDGDVLQVVTPKQAGAK